MSAEQEDLDDVYAVINEEFEEDTDPSPSSSFWTKVIGAISSIFIASGTIAPTMYYNFAKLYLSTPRTLMYRRGSGSATPSGSAAVSTARTTPA